MNSLSWILYAAEVFGRLGIVCGLLGAVGALGMLGLAADILVEDSGTDKSEFALRYIFWRLWVPVVLVLIAIFAPSSQTVYMIAASQAAETVATTPEAKAMLGDIKIIIAKQLSEAAK